MEMMPGVGPAPDAERTYEQPDPKVAETAKPEIAVPQGPDPSTGRPQYEVAGQTPGGEEIVRQAPQPVAPEPPKAPEAQPVMPPVDGGENIPQAPENPNDGQTPPKPQGFIARFFGNFFGPKAPKTEAPIQQLDNTQEVPKTAAPIAERFDNSLEVPKTDQAPNPAETTQNQG